MYTLKEVKECYDESYENFERNLRYSKVKLPFMGYKECNCNGILLSERLYLQCEEVCEGLCKKCKKTSVEGEGISKYGHASERGSEGWNPLIGKEALTWMQYLCKKKLTKEDGIAILKGVKINEKEWNGKEKLKKDKRMTFETSRFIPITGMLVSESRKVTKGERKGENNLNVHLYNNGSGKRIICHYNKRTGKVRKSNGMFWTTEANKKFVEMYGDLDENGLGFDEGTFSKISAKQDSRDDMVELLNLEREKMVKDLNEGMEKEKNKDKKEMEMMREMVKEMREKMAKMESNVETKVETKLKKKIKFGKSAAKKAEELKEELAKEELAKKELVKEDEFAEFEDDDEGFEFNPYEHEGVTYHKEGNDLYHYPPGEDGEVEHFMEL